MYRLSAILFGIYFLLWVPFEDTRLTHILVLAAGAVSLAGIRLWSRMKEKSCTKLLLINTLSGSLLSLAAAGLMIFKIGLHGHGSPDFEFGEILWVLSRTPYLGFAGLLFGLGLCTRTWAGEEEEHRK
jgi:hypothetical protein